MSLEKILASGRDGGCILFCGSGFSADCLTFSDTLAGTVSPLHQALNDALGYEYTDIQIAADDYMHEHGEHGLLSLLRENYSISKRTSAVDQILAYPWDRIYTTNYDDVISQSLTAKNIAHHVANNLETPQDVMKHAPNRKLVIHLHGCLRSWNIENFRQSCVLGRESYLRIASAANWSPVLREDYARAVAVVFVGFSNSDFYLAQELYSAAGSREKVYFINSEDAGNNREILAKQRNFGQSLSIGNERFADLIIRARNDPSEPELATRSFQLATPPAAAAERASVQEQENYIIYGQSSESLLFRDVLDDSESYRASRSHTERLVNFLKEDKTVALIVGGICSGKSLIFEETILRLCAEGRKVYVLRNKFYDLFDEIKRIATVDNTFVIAIDDCFSLRGELRDIAKLADEANASLLLASRSIAYDSEEDIRNHISEDTQFQVFDTEVLDDNEAHSVIRCTDRIGGWGTSVRSGREKYLAVTRSHSSRLSGFLLNRFRSEHIRARFLSELDVFRSAGATAVEALILAMYLRHIGETVQENVLSEMLGCDALDAVNSQLGSSAFISFNAERKTFVLLPSISARDVLAQLFLDREVTSAVIRALTNLAPARHEYSYRRIFRELMRYTQLKQVVNDYGEQDRFFDRLSEMEFCRRHVLFWLQWSMAMRDQKDYDKARQYLDEAYGMSANWKDFDTHHLDDQKAGLILDSVRAGEPSGVYLQRMREVHGIISRLISRREQTSHPYTTILSMKGFFEKALPMLSSEHRELMARYAETIGSQVQKQANMQHDGFIRTSMQQAKDCTDDIVEACRQALC